MHIPAHKTVKEVEVGMSFFDCTYKLSAMYYNWTSVSVAGAISEDVPITSAAAALEANDPANAVVLDTSSWPVAALWPDVNSRSSDFDAVEPVMLQFTLTDNYSTRSYGFRYRRRRAG